MEASFLLNTLWQEKIIFNFPFKPLGKIGQPFVSIYSGSKFALHGFFEGLRQEMKMRNCDISITTCILGLIGRSKSTIDEDA